MNTKNMSPKRLLDVSNVQVHFPLREGLVKAVDGVAYHVNKGEVLGIVGESGSGKSITARTILRLLPPPGTRCRRPGADVAKNRARARIVILCAQ
ncbi:MAG: ATP-binding cassette domain-containing protein [Candidatus Devosia euplotis]|nr:ATP-binding cassette domain-containing protein [Candidatus Devosia euplotis]